MLRALLLIHRWLGFALAAYVVLIALSGGVLVMHDEAARYFRAPAVAPTGAAVLEADAIVDRIKAAYPDWHLQTLWWPDRDFQPAWFAEVRKGTVGSIGETALALYLHPESGDVLLAHNYSRSVWRWLQLLHFNLLSGRDGRTVNGVLALATLFVTLTGVLIWWRNRVWWATMRRRRWPLDWHQVLGAYTLPLLLIACTTGAYFAWRADVHRMIAAVAPIQFMNRAITPIAPIPQPPFVPLSAYEPQLRALVPDHPVTRVLFPERPDQPIRFVIYEGTRREFHKASNVFFHPSSGELLRADLVRERLAGDSLINWIGAVHFGAFGGLPIKLLWMAGAMAVAAMTVLGVVVFVQRRW